MDAPGDCPAECDEDEHPDAAADQEHQAREGEENGRAVRSVDEADRPDDDRQANGHRQDPGHQEIRHDRECLLRAVDPHLLLRPDRPNDQLPGGGVAPEHLEEAVVQTGDPYHGAERRRHGSGSRRGGSRPS
jgi:hypothetical protein